MKKHEYCTIIQNEKYHIEITEDETFVVDSNDNAKYDYVLNPLVKCSDNMYKVLNIVIQGYQNCTAALIGDINTFVVDCAILDKNVLTVLQNDYITQIDLDSMRIVAGYELDVFGTTFSIYKMSDGYLIYGEIEIIKLDNNFQVLWRFGGRDILYMELVLVLIQTSLFQAYITVFLSQISVIMESLMARHPLQVW